MTRRRRPGSAPIPAQGPILGVDLGEVRTGLAISDPDQIVATALDTLDGSDLGDDALADRIATAASGRTAVGVVVGLPRRLDGREGGAAHRVRRMADRIQRCTGLVVDVWDERFTTTEAERLMIDHGVRRRDRRQAVDRVAATLILQGYLDARRTQRSGR
ncbi:MAG TPA: Holliday junction resolvase RuvX [Nitriliruptorales bacterium]